MSTNNPSNAATISPSPTYSQPSSEKPIQVDPLSAWSNWIMWGAIILAILVISPLRNFSGRLIGSLIQWALSESGLMLGRTVLWLIKTVIGAHWIVIRNLLSPRSAMVLTKGGDSTQNYGG
ncbi:hypothetical protein KBW71_07895 [Hydrogenophaga aromaticivorans]|jgi:hypothetical protein|uniref:hypothetical protein n=1 Tax=Hydrogenophaga aromaticivorans TaxID=2610898 RepID=UPI001B359514|nr:hypothetical protein [Hydrogenophaga aromaticivorans]MBQ0918363.1 hypothetical protein [Hydrogenophaga aromaticivorans]